MKGAISASAGFNVLEYRVIDSWITEIRTLLPFPHSNALFYALNVVANDIEYVVLQSQLDDAEEEEEEEEEEPSRRAPQQGQTA